MGLLHFPDGLEIEAPMIHKSAVLRCDNGRHHRLGNIVNIDPDVMIPEILLVPILNASLQHQRSPSDQYELVQRHPGNGEQDEAGRHVQEQDFRYPFYSGFEFHALESCSKVSENRVITCIKS